MSSERSSQKHFSDGSRSGDDGAGGDVLGRASSSRQSAERRGERGHLRQMQQRERPRTQLRLEGRCGEDMASRREVHGGIAGEAARHPRPGHRHAVRLGRAEEGHAGRARHRRPQESRQGRRVVPGASVYY